jgi:hypothetical protein
VVVRGLVRRFEGREVDLRQGDLLMVDHCRTLECALGCAVCDSGLVTCEDLRVDMN